MSQNKSFRLRYVGTRFEGKRLPVDVLTDLPAFRELVVAFAKSEWRRLNEDRKRVPRGFDASLAFDLVGIEDGSAVPVMEWNRAKTQASLPGFTDQIEDLVRSSFQKVVVLFDDAASNRFPVAMAPEQIRALNKFGSNLRDNERIDFEGTKNDKGNVIYLSSEIRKRLIGSLQDRLRHPDRGRRDSSWMRSGFSVRTSAISSSRPMIMAVFGFPSTTRRSSRISTAISTSRSNLA